MCRIYQVLETSQRFVGRFSACSREGLLCSKSCVMFPAVSLGPVISNHGTRGKD